ncbi:MAG: c-type cytochrome [Acidobacteriota bacterium]
MSPTKREIVVVLGMLAVGLVQAQEPGWPVPSEFRALRNPVQTTAEVVGEGRKLYESHCLRCHGAAGAGDGPAAAFVKPAPLEIASASAQARSTDGELFYRISEGKSPMPPMKQTLSVEDRWKVVQFIRTLRPQAASAEARAEPGPLAPQQVVEAWFARWNALDGTDATAERLIELYAPDALHSTGPATHQMGTVTFRGHEGIRKMLAAFTSAFESPSYRIEAVTAQEVTARLFNTVSGPWGGPSVAVEYAAAFTSREDGRRYFQPGAAFFQIQADGKIRRLRLYVPAGEMAEVEPDVSPRRRP